MEIEKAKAIIEAILFASGRIVKILELSAILELTPNDIENIVENMRSEYNSPERGIEIIKVNDGYQICTKPEYNGYICEILDNRTKPNLSNAAIETLSIIAYNPKITRAEIEQVRGVNSDGTIYRLLEYSLIKESGKSDAPGKPTMYETTDEFLKTFGMSTLDDLPELPKYKIDENEQIVIDDVIEEKENIKHEEG